MQPESDAQTVHSLPVELPRYLQDPRVARAVYDSEVASHVHGGRRVVELGVIEEVKPLGADLQAAALAQFPDGEILAYTEIPVIDAEPVLRIPSQVTEKSSSRCGVSGAI